MVEGYVSISRAAEDAVWSDATKQASSTRRVFILAEKEGPELLKHQLKTFIDMKKNGADVALVIVKGAGHFVPGTSPAAFNLALLFAIQDFTPDQPRMVLLDTDAPQDKQFHAVTLENIEKAIR